MKSEKIFISFLIMGWILGTLIVPDVSMALTAEEEFYRAEVFYKNFLEETEKVNYRDYWLRCIEKFQTAYSKDPAGPLAPASLYMSGKLFHELYKKSFKSSDKKSAIDYFERVIKRFPGSNYSPRAEGCIRILKPSESGKEDIKSKTIGTAGSSLKIKTRETICKQSKAEYKASLNQRPSRNMIAYNRPFDLSVLRYRDTKPDKPDIRKGMATITGLRVWSNPSYTRIVIDADNDTTYAHKLLDKDPSINKPQRLYVDFKGSKLGNIKKIIPINDNLLINARAGQYQPDLVRVVVDIKSFKNYKIFSLKNPFRTVIDVWGKDASRVYMAKKPVKAPDPIDVWGKDTSKDYATDAWDKNTRNARKSSTAKSDKKPVVKKKYVKKEHSKKATSPEKKWRLLPEDSKFSSHDLAKQFALGVKRIVIDPGHGGHDPGAVGYNKSVLEKDIVLSLAKRLARKIRYQLGCEVVMTRSTDRFISLEERTAIANTKNADLFISLHTNAHKDKRAYGIETYFLNLATDDDAILVAARENATSRKNISDLQRILNDLMQNSKINESSRLATRIQKSLYGHVKKRYTRIKDKGVKQAPFYVLLGADMPSVLVEVSFISNKKECERLKTSSYQDAICDGITNGILEYIRETSPMALSRNR